MTQPTVATPINPFLQITDEMRSKVERNQHEELTKYVRWLSSPGKGEEWMIKAWLEGIQTCIRTLHEYGFRDVRLLDEKQFEQLVEAFGVLKRGGLKEEARQLAFNLLLGCGISEDKLKEK